MADGGIDKAAAVFDAVIESTPGRANRSPADNGSRPPSEAVFRNVGELDPDTEAQGGGDNEPDPEEAIYGGSKGDKAGSGDTGEGPDEAGEGDGDSGPDDSGEGDGDDTPDKEGEEGKDTVLAQKVEASVDGEPVEVTVKEALEGYVRTETFHRRMNQLDEAKKIVRRAAADAVQNYEYSMNVARQMEAHMEQMIPKEPSWDEEFAKDPAKARQLEQYYEKANGFRSQMQNQLKEALAKQNASQMTQLAAFAEEENTKFEQANRKHWTDPKRKVKDLQSMRKTALSTGFSEEELSQVYDSRMLMVLLKASKYDRMMAAKPKPVIRPQGRPIPPGAGSDKQRTAQKGVTSAMKRLNRTGSIEDASVVFDQLIAKG